MQAPHISKSPPLESALQRAVVDYRKGLPTDWRGAYCAALLDDACNIVAATPTARMIEISSATAAMCSFFGDDWCAGDVAITNDPYHGSAHLLHFTAISPVGMSSGGKLKGFAAFHADLPDVGGWDIGGDDPRSLDIWAEGARIVPVKAALSGRMRRELLELLALNSRTPKLVQRVVAALSGAVIELAQEANIVNSEPRAAALRAREAAQLAIDDLLRRFPRGAFYGSNAAQVPGFPELQVFIKVRLTVEDGVVCLEVLRAPEKSVRPINATPTMTQAAVHQAIEAALGLEPWMSLGLQGRVRISAPPESAVAVTEWLPVGYARWATCRAVFSAVLAALGAAGFDGVDAEHSWRSFSSLDDADIDLGSGRASASRRNFLQSMERAAGGRA